MSNCIILGEIKQNKLDGKGIRLNNQTISIGEWRNGQLHGHGIEVDYCASEAQAKYEGKFVDGWMEGFGKKYWINGESYEGEWLGSFLHGQGTYKWSDFCDGGIVSHTGCWLRGFAHGQGCRVSRNGDIYNGGWHFGLKQGPGKITTKFDAVYTGMFYNGELHGHGEFSHPGGYSWAGHWSSSVPEDITMAIHPDLRKFLQQGKCSKYLSPSCSSAQVLYQCRTCSNDAELIKRNGNLCMNCMKICHATHTSFYAACWDFGDSSCTCTLCS